MHQPHRPYEKEEEQTPVYGGQVCSGAASVARNRRQLSFCREGHRRCPDAGPVSAGGAAAGALKSRSSSERFLFSSAPVLVMTAENYNKKANLQWQWCAIFCRRVPRQR